MNKQLFVSILSFFLLIQAAHGSTSPELVNAATAGQTKELVALIDGGADVQSDGGTALISAAFSALQRHEESKPIDDQVKAVRILAEAGADVNATNNADGGTPLIFAVYGGSTETVSLLLESGADISATDSGTGNEDGRTALSYAEEKEHAEITEVLRQAGAK